MNLADCVDPLTFHVRAECATGSLVRPQSRIFEPPVPDARNWTFSIIEPTQKRERLSRDAIRVRQFIAEREGVLAPEICRVCKLPNSQVASIVQRLQLRGEVRRTGERGQFKYLASAELGYRNRSRIAGEDRDAQIIDVIRGFKRVCRFHEIYTRIKGARGYLSERLRVMVEDGRVQRQPCNSKDFQYWVVE